MPDWCVCGHKADILCSRCRKPTCARGGDVSKHWYAIKNVQLGQDLWIDLKADGMYLSSTAVCPDCLPHAATDEYETKIRPRMGVSRLNPFETACLATRYNRYDADFNRYPKDGTVIPSDASITLMWGVTRWRCGAPTRMRESEFAAEFLAAARARDLRPESVKIGRFRHVEVYKIRFSDSEGYGGTEAIVGTDGRLYETVSKGSRGSVLVPSTHPEREMFIGTGCADTLGLALSAR